MAFSPNGKWLATAGEAGDKTIRIWDVAKMELIQVLDQHKDCVYALAFSPDGKRLASGSTDGTARLWDTATWRESAVLKHGVNVYGVAFTPDATRLACASARQLHPLLGRGNTSVGRGIAWARRLCPRPRLQPRRHPPGFRVRRLHGSRLGHRSPAGSALMRGSTSSMLKVGIAEVVRLQRIRTLTSAATEKHALTGHRGPADSRPVPFEAIPFPCAL